MKLVNAENQSIDSTCTTQIVRKPAMIARAMANPDMMTVLTLR